MKIKEVITDRVRKLLNDADKNRWTDDLDLIRWYNDAVLTTIALRPDVGVDDAGVPIVFEAVPVNAESLERERLLPDRFVSPEVDFIMFRAYGMEGGDTRDNENSITHWDNYSRFINLL